MATLTDLTEFKERSVLENQLCIAFPYPPAASGGPGTFQTRLTEELTSRGWRVVVGKEAETPDVILVVGGTTRIGWLLKMKLKRVPIVHRVAAIHWRHKVEKVSLRIFLLLSVRNQIVRVIRKYFANHIIYQSEFARDWWIRKRGQINLSSSLIYNGTNLSLFTPKRSRSGPDVIQIVCAEGSIPTDPFVLPLIEKIAFSKPNGKSVVITILGKVSNTLQENLACYPNVHALGHVPRLKMPELLTGSDIFLSLEINAACPNSIVEAMAAGLPVVALDTGASPELIAHGAGIVIPYNNADPWKLEKPVIDDEVVDAIADIELNLDAYSVAARNQAERYHDANQMADKYIEIFKQVIS